MKRTYVKNRGRRSKARADRHTDADLPDRTVSFLKSSSDLATSSILRSIRKLLPSDRSALNHGARAVLRGKRLKRDVALRSGAVRLVVALLPQTFDLFEELLSDCSSPVWYEAQFTAFSALDRGDLRKRDQNRVLALLERYLTNIKSGSGYAAWKAGDLLGDEWNSPETVQALERLLFSAKSVAGRKAALHGIEHAIKKALPSERERLFSLIRKVASVDRSGEVRKDASLALKGVGCHHLNSEGSASPS
jgi:hypothetical protein